MKIVINSCFGGFGLSPEAELWIYEHGGKNFIPVEEYFQSSSPNTGGMLSYNAQLAGWKKYLAGEKVSSIVFTVFSPDLNYVLDTDNYDRMKRSDPILVECVETLGKKANGPHASLKIVEIPDGIPWSIRDYDGNETIEEEHRSWS